MLEENNYLVCQLPGTAMQTDIQKVQDKYKAIEPDIITDSLCCEQLNYSSRWWNVQLAVIYVERVI